MDSAYAEVAVLLINVGADRTRVRIHWTYPLAQSMSEEPPSSLVGNLEGETPENILGVGGQEQKLARQHVIDRCGKP